MGLFGKKPNHYRNDKKKKDDRQVMSFEQLPLEEYEKQESSGIRLDKKKLIIAAGILVLLVLCVVLYFTRGNIASCVDNIGRGRSFTSVVSGSSVDAGNFRTFSQGLCYASDTGFVCLDSQGQELFSTQHGYARPVMKTTDTAVLVYDLGSTGFMIADDSHIIHSSDAEYNIYLADLASDMSYALVTEESGYNARLSAFTAEHKIRYSYSFSEYYITSMALSPDGSGAVVCGISADKGSSVSIIYVVDFSKEEPVAKHQITGDMLFDCNYLSRNSVCAIGSDASYVVNGSKFSSLQKKSYSQMTLTAYDINTDVGVLALSLSRSGDGRNCSVEYVNASGKTEKTIETDKALISVSTYKDRLAVCDTQGVHLYRYNGDLISSQEVNSDCKQIRLASTNFVYILGLSDINGISL